MIVAAYPTVRAGLIALLAQYPDIEPSDATPESTHAPAVIVVHAAGASDDQFEDLTDAYPTSAFVIVGGDPATDGPGLEEGAIGYIGSSADGATLAMTVRAVASGLTVIDPAVIVASGVHVHSAVQPAVAVTPGDALSSREREVLELVAAGLPNKAIARELGISEHTAKFHVGSLLAKLGAGSRTEAVTLATRRGILSI